MPAVPYVKSPDKNACALACHLMVARTFFPETTIEDLKVILRWQSGHVVWGFPFWQWLIDKKMSVTDWDNFPYQTWAEKGFAALQAEIPPSNFDYISQWTYKPDDYQADIQQLFVTKGFVYYQKVPEIEDVQAALAKNAVCEVTLDSCILNGRSGFAIHRVVVLDITDTHIVFHDPARPEDQDRPYRSETVDHFLTAWPKEVRELCVYSKAA